MSISSLHALPIASLLALPQDSFGSESISARFGELLLQSLAVVAGTAVVAWLASVLVRLLFQTLGVGDQVSRILGKVALLFVIAVGLVALIGRWGVDTSGLGPLVKFGALGLFLIGCYAALPPLRCLVAGAAVRHGGTFREGDELEDGETRGQLSELGAFHAVLELEDGSERIVPNSDLFQGRWQRTRPSPG